MALNYSMRSNGGFEGNAQTLRICTKLGEYSEASGLNLTRRALLGVLKYPAPYSRVANYSLYKEERAPLNLDSFKPPKCIFDCDEDSFEFIMEPVKGERAQFQTTDSQAGKHRKTKFKGLDTTILELGDDIAYGVHDLEDAIALKLVSLDKWKSLVVDHIVDSAASLPLKSKIEQITENLFSGENKIRKKSISYLVGYFIRSCRLSQLGKFKSPYLDTQANMSKEAKQELKLLQDFVNSQVIKTVEVQTLEYKGQQMIVRLFEAIANNPARLLHKRYFQQYEESGKDTRRICDYLAGTTDDYSTRLYHKIFTPSSGSIFDRV